MIEDCCKNRGELQKLIEELRNQHYFGELQKLASVYPESSENFHLLFSNPSLLAKKYKVPLWRRIVRLRWLLINPLYRLKYDKDLSSVVWMLDTDPAMSQFADGEMQISLIGRDLALWSNRKDILSTRKRSLSWLWGTWKKCTSELICSPWYIIKFVNGFY